MCQCPVAGLLHFYYIEWTGTYIYSDMCQCPVAGLLHFYLQKQPRQLIKQYGVNALWRAYSISTNLYHLDNKRLDICVNALWRAYSISTGINAGCPGIKRCVSMPCGGLTPFLLGWKRRHCGGQGAVSMPCGGLTPFLRSTVIGFDNNRCFVSMPCGGLTPFLRPVQEPGTGQEPEVSMPCGGLTPFLRENTASTSKEGEKCQCPVAGLLHFYLHGQRLMSLLQGGVNALWRAYSISTDFSDLVLGAIGTVCQCPVAGLLHFYWGRLWTTQKSHFCVSMPCGGLTPFLPQRTGKTSS